MTGRRRGLHRADPAVDGAGAPPDHRRAPAAEVGGEVGAEVERAEDHLVVRCLGTLSRSTAPRLGVLLDALLEEGDPVLVDLARLRVGWPPGVEVFAMAQRAAGGWPVARLVLFGPDEALGAALRAARVPERVPVVADRRTAAARRHERPDLVQRHISLPSTTAAARLARHATQTACRDWHLPHLASALALISDELVTNAVEHTEGGAELTLRLQGSEVTVGVRDALAHVVPRPQLSSVGRPCGRGLQVVNALSRRWGVAPHEGGKTVWAELSIDVPPPEGNEAR